MVYVVVEELIPEMSAGRHSNLGTVFFALGFTVMLTLDVALGWGDEYETDAEPRYDGTGAFPWQRESISKYSLEDGHFELNDKTDASLLSAIASGEKADVKFYYTDKARAELDGKFEDEFKVEFSKKL